MAQTCAGRPAGRGRSLDRPADQDEDTDRRPSACVARSWRSSGHDAFRAGTGILRGRQQCVRLVVLHVCENTGRELQARQREPRGYGEEKVEQQEEYNKTVRDLAVILPKKK